MNNNCLHPRGGWSPEETDMLFAEILAAEQNGNSIKSAFDKVAHATGRKPNSIRNYYYLKIKENSELAHAAFVPFTREEVRSLMRTMLEQQADGKSVRGIALELGNGDKKAMLRYQNKYRSILRTDPDYVRMLMAEMRQEGTACADPFCRKSRPQDLGAILTELVEELSAANVDTEGLFGALLTLARSASRRTFSPEDSRVQQLLTELSAAKKENMLLREQFGSLSAVSMSFINKNSIERIAGMNDYVSEMQRIIG